MTHTSVPELHGIKVEKSKALMNEVGFYVLEEKIRWKKYFMLESEWFITQKSWQHYLSPKAGPVHSIEGWKGRSQIASGHLDITHDIDLYSSHDNHLHQLGI